MSTKQPVKATRIGAAVALMLAGALPLRAQIAPRVDLGGTIEVGGEAERYLRALQVAGLAPLTSWSIQPFSPSQTKHMRPVSDHPWRARFDSVQSGSRLELLLPKARLIDNSSFAFQDGPGPTWSGRGVTGEIQAGVFAQWKPITLQIAPLAFVAQNESFPLAANNAPGNARFGDPRFPGEIDAPQRFGDARYGRLAFGTSSLTITAPGIVLGASSAPERWGPAMDFPLVLGPNAGGFPSVFAGTSSPLNLWLVRVHARVVYGQLTQSDLTAPVDGERQRLGSGFVFAVSPRGIPGLEVGGTRFIHQPWPAGGVTLADLKRPLSGGLNIGSVATDIRTENQIASVFGRWALPAAKAEFYGELYREDFPGKFHEALSLVEKPDDLAAFTLGFQRVLVASAGRLRALRAEIVNGLVSHQERNERGFERPIPPYYHAAVTQGHTLNGLILGSPEAYGGSGWRITLDDYTPNGRRSFALERYLRFDWLPTSPATTHPDIIYALRADVIRFQHGRDVGLTLIPAIDLNRNLVVDHDVFNLYVAITVHGMRR